MRYNRLLICVLGAMLYSPHPVSGQISGTPSPVRSEPATAKTVEKRPEKPKVFEIVLPVRLDDRVIGPVPVRSTTDALLGIDAHRLADVLATEIDDNLLTALRDLDTGIVPLEGVEGSGLTVSFDRQALAIKVEIADTARATQTLNLASGTRYNGYELTQPANLAIGLDADLVLGSALEDTNSDAASVFFNSFANIGGYNGVYLNASGSLDLLADADQPSLQRDRLTLFKDDITNAVRYSSVDVFLDQPPLSGNPTLLGLSVERRYDEINPDRTTRALSDRSLILDRAGLVEITVNDIVVKRFTAGPGRVDLSDIPFVGTGNQVVITVEDALGRREIDTFNFSSHEDLLAPGLSEFGLSAGYIQPDVADGIEWQTQDPAGVGYYRRGITAGLTLGGFASGRDRYASFGANLVAAVPFGVLQIDGAAAFSGDTETRETSFAMQAFYTADLDSLIAPGHQFDFRLAFTGEDFRTLEQPDSAVREDRISANATYRLPLNERTTLTLAGGYVKEVEREARLSIGLSHRFQQFVGSLLFQQNFHETESDETALFASLSFPFWNNHRFRASHSTTDRRSVVEVERRGDKPIDDYQYRLRAEHDEGGVILSGDAGYTGNRFLVSGTVSHGTNDDARATVGTLRFGSGIAFADGHFGIGRRVSGGFVMVSPHETLSESTLKVSATRQQTPQARSDIFGPALVPVGRRYGIGEYAVTIEDAPLGYDIGPGSYAVRSGALSGFAVTVGSDAYRSVRGIAQDQNAEPIALKTGTLIRSDGGQEPTDIFTNRTGRFAATGLAPGAYVLQLDKLRAKFVVQDDNEAFADLGVLVLE